MNRADTIELLTYIVAADNRNPGEADIQFWMQTVPGWITLDLAKAAVRQFFGEAAGRPDERLFFTTRHLIACAKIVKKRQQIEAAREAAKRPAISQRSIMPPDFRRQLEEAREAARVPHVVTEKHEVRMNPVINYGEALKAP